MQDLHQAGSGDDSDHSLSPQDLHGDSQAIGSSSTNETKANGTKGKPRGPRISLACKTCRGQKMRCSGGAPCERCRRGGHKCVYEAAQRRRKSTKQDPNTQSLLRRAEVLEGRLTQLEADRSPSPGHPESSAAAAASSSVTLPEVQVSDQPMWFQPGSATPSSSTNQHMLGLDAFLYAAGSQGPTAQPRAVPAGPSSAVEHPTYHPPQPTGASLGLSPIYPESPFGSLSASSGLATSPGLSSGLPSTKRSRSNYEPDPAPAGSPFSYPSPDHSLVQASQNDAPFFVNAPMNRIDRLELMRQWENDSSWAQLLSQQVEPPNLTPPPVGLQHELLHKGVLTEETLQRYWWRFHNACAYRVGWHSDGGILQLALRESKLLVAAACSVGARSLQAHADAANCLNEAKLYARDLVFYSDLKGSPADYLDIKGLLVLSVYWSLPHLMAQIVSIAHTMGLHGAFTKMTDPELRGQADEHLLIQKGRTWTLITIYAHINSIFYNQVSPISADFELTKQQCDVLRNSPATHAQVDACLCCHAHLFALLANVQREMQGKQGSVEACRSIAGFLSQLESWWIEWSSAGGDSPFSTKDIEYFLTAYQLAQLYICVFGFSPVRDGFAIASNQTIAKYATQAMSCAKAVLDCSLNHDRCAPRQGLAIDFTLTGMGFALSQVFALVFAVPGRFDLLDIRQTLSGLFSSFYSFEVSPYAPIMSSLLSKFDALLVLSRRMPEQLAPQRLDPESITMIETLASDPGFYQCVISEPWEPSI